MQSPYLQDLPGLVSECLQDEREQHLVRLLGLRRLGLVDLLHVAPEALGEHGHAARGLALGLGEAGLLLVALLALGLGRAVAVLLLLLQLGLGPDGAVAHLRALGGK